MSDVGYCVNQKVNIKTVFPKKKIETRIEVESFFQKIISR